MEQILKNALKDMGMTQKELADALHVTPQAVSKWFTGEGRPSQDSVIGIYKILGVDLTKMMVQKMKQEDRKSAMGNHDLNEINTYEKAKNEATSILNYVGIASNYSHTVYKLCSWLLPATIGLTYHAMINGKVEELDYSDIFGYLNDYFDDFIKSAKGLYENQLEYQFYIMGMDLFESFDEATLPNHDYCEAAMHDWYRFYNAMNKVPETSRFIDFKVALTEIIERME